MSPEIINPQDFGLNDSRPTKSSDCYSLGMVIYETISGHRPFHEYRDYTVPLKVTQGEHPLREDGFTDSLWEMLERCWAYQPSARPSVENVLQYLERPFGPSSVTNREASKRADIFSGMFRTLSMFHSAAHDIHPTGSSLVHGEFLDAFTRVDLTNYWFSGSPSSSNLISTRDPFFTNPTGLNSITPGTDTIDDVVRSTVSQWPFCIHHRLVIHENV